MDGCGDAGWGRGRREGGENGSRTEDQGARDEVATTIKSKGATIIWRRSRSTTTTTTPQHARQSARVPSTHFINKPTVPRGVFSRGGRGEENQKKKKKQSPASTSYLSPPPPTPILALALAFSINSFTSGLSQLLSSSLTTAPRETEPSPKSETPLE